MSAKIWAAWPAMLALSVASPHLATAADSTILLSGKLFGDLGEVISVAGTLTGDGIAYPNNSYSIWCDRSRNECLVASVEQIGPNQMGRVDYPYAMPVVRWNSDEVVAAADPSFASCSRDTITIKRRTKQIDWAQEPINQATELCAKSDHAAHRWTIEDSPGEKQLHAK